MSTDLPTGSRPARVAFYNDPKIRSIAYQVALCAVIGFLVYGAASNAIVNLERAHIASGFGFWNTTAGFEISQSLIKFDSQVSTYGRAFWVGLLNTLLVAGLGIVFASVLGFVIGIARLSKNWLVAKVAAGYVETIRNIPLLLQLLFWYNAVLKALPGIRESFAIPGGIYLNNRGLFIPQPIFKSGFGWVLIAFAVSEVAFPAYFLLYELASDLLILHFSLYVNQNFETLQAKRLLPLVFGGAQLGTIVGGVFLALTAPLVGVPNILLIWGGLIIAAMVLMIAHHRRQGVSPYFRPGRKSAGELRQCLSQITHGLKFAKRSELVRYSSLALFFTAIMFYILSYSVNRVYAETFTTEESLTAFFGVLSAVTSALALLIQIFLTNKLLHRFGVRTVNLIFPVTSVVSYGLLILSFSLPAAIFASINKDALMKAFRNPVRNLLFNALPNYMQGRARAMAAGLVLPLALALAGGILVLAQIYKVPIYFLLAGLGASLLYLYFNTRTNRAYVSGMIAVLREKLFLPDQPLDMVYTSAGDELLKELRRGVQQPDDEISVAYAKKLVALFFHHSAEIILSRHETASHAARDQLIRLLMPFNPPPLADYLWKQLDQADDHLKATILEWFFERRDECAVNLVETALASSNPTQPLPAEYPSEKAFFTVTFFYNETPQ